MNQPASHLSVEPDNRAPENTAVALIVYVLYLLSYAGFLLPLVIGAVIAYISKADASHWLAGHYRFQIRTFWIGMVYVIVLTPIVFLLAFTVILYPLALLLAPLPMLWLIVRCVRGIIYLQKRQVPANLNGWLY